MRVFPNLQIERSAPLYRITIDRPDVRNAVDGPTAASLAAAFREFDSDPSFKVAILSGAGSHFCAGADLKAVHESGTGLRRAARWAAQVEKRFGERATRVLRFGRSLPVVRKLLASPGGRANRLAVDGDGPMGPTRMHLSKPVIAAVSGYCVAGGLELALWCDLRIADDSAVFGVFCRRFGVPLIDGGTVRLPRLIGMSRALDMILTGRAVDADEALAIGLANRLVASGQALIEAEKLALQIAAFPQTCMRGDRRSAYEQWQLDERSAIANEFGHGLHALLAGETVAGAGRFAQGDGRHGQP